MRLLLLSSALTVGAGLGLAASAQAASSEGPPPPAPIFYCPMPAPPAAQPRALACPAHTRAFRVRHVQRMRHGLRVRVAGAERPYNPEDDGVSASQAWVYRYELAQGGLHPWEVDGRWDVRPRHPLWVAPPSPEFASREDRHPVWHEAAPAPPPPPPLEHRWSGADGHEDPNAEEHRFADQDRDDDAQAWGHHHHHHDHADDRHQMARVDRDQHQERRQDRTDEGSAYRQGEAQFSGRDYRYGHGGDRADADEHGPGDRELAQADDGDRYGSGHASHDYSYERQHYDNGGGSVEGDRNGRAYSHSWGDGGRGAELDADQDGRYRQGYSERFGQADRDAAGYAHHSGGGYSYSEEGGDTGWRGGYVGEGAGSNLRYGYGQGGGYAQDDRGYGANGLGQAGDSQFSDAPDGQPAWRTNTGGGYEVYSAAGRDSQGYLVWAGKPRAPGQ